MSRDFTLEKYRELLQSFHAADYRFATFEDYCNGFSSDRYVILRHDVDSKAGNSLATARIEHALGIKASYYFRVVEQSNKPEIISEIVALGHEIGYHYEDMSLFEGDKDKAFEHFKKHLGYLRQFYPVKTICMHGSPRSKFDGRDLWKHFDYRELGLIGEPYLDADFSQLFYLTDTGRRWDGFNVSVRDKVPVHQDEWARKGLVYHSTDDVINAMANQLLPKKLMLTTHPQRWTNRRSEWLVEYFLQLGKNLIKGMKVKQDRF